MLFFYIKALHIIFIVTWFSGMFYMPRLLIYNREAEDKPSPEREILHRQFGIMLKRLWLGITWPSAILTLGFGIWIGVLYGSIPAWLWVKLGFVVLLYGYHLTLQHIFKQQARGTYKYSSRQLRVWNELATVFLVAIVMLVTVKQEISVVWGIAGIIVLVLALTAAIKIYGIWRKDEVRPEA